VEFDGFFYSVPQALIRAQVDMRITSRTIEVFHRAERVAAHERRYAGGRHGTPPEHMPSSHRRYAEWAPARFHRWARSIGPNTEGLVVAILANRPHPEQGFRTCLGIPRLFRGLDPARAEDPQFHDLSPLQEPSSFEDRRHCLLDPRGPRPRLLRTGEVKQVSPLSTRRQRLEGALEPRIVAELLLQLLGHGKLWGLRLDLNSGLLGRHGLAHVGLDGGRFRRNLLGAGELHHPRCLNLA